MKGGEEEEEEEDDDGIAAVVVVRRWVMTIHSRPKSKSKSTSAALLF